MLGQFLNRAFSGHSFAPLAVTARKIIILATLALVFSPLAFSQTTSWDGGAGDGLWSSALNWDSDSVPTTGNVIIDAPGTYTVTLDLGFVGLTSLTLGTSGTGQQTLDLDGNTMGITSTGSILLTGRLIAKSSSIPDKRASKARPAPLVTNLGAIEFDGVDFSPDIDNQGQMDVRGTCHFTGLFINNSFLRVLGSVSGAGHLDVNNGVLQLANNGTLRLDSETSGMDAMITVAGTLFNTGNLISDDNAAAGGARVLDATLNNSTGSVVVNYPMRIIGSDRSHQNDSTMTVRAELDIQQSGTSPSFTNNSTGTVRIDIGGIFRLQNGYLSNIGGVFTDNVMSRKGGGLPQLILENLAYSGTMTNTALEVVFDNCSIQDYASFTNNADMRVLNTLNVGQMATFINSATGNIFVESRSSTPATLQVNRYFTSWFNNGDIFLTSTAPEDTTLEVIGGNFENLGQLNAEAGAGGERKVNAVLDNNGGEVNGNSNLTIFSASGNHTNRSGSRINVNNGTTHFDLPNSTILFQNDGTITTQSSGTLWVSGGQFSTVDDISKSASQALPASGLIILEGLTLLNSSITNVGTIALVNSTVDSTTTLNNQGDLYIKGTVPMGGDLTNSTGTIIIEGTSSFGTATLQFSDPWANAATIQLTSIDFQEASIEISAGQTLSNFGTIESLPGSGGSRNILAELDNQGTVNVNQELFIKPGVDVAHSNSGTIHVITSFCTYELLAGSLTNSSLIQVEDGAQFLVAGGTFNQNGSLSMPVVRKPSKLASLPRFFFNAGELTGTISNPIGAAIYFHDNTFSSGSFDNSGTAQIRGTVHFMGSFSNNPNGLVDILSTINDGSAVLQLDNSTTNSGTIELNDNDGSYTEISCDSTFTNDGVMTCLTGAGGIRNLNFVLDNNGTLETRAPTILSFPSGSASNDSLIDVASSTLTVDMDFTSVFTNNADIDIHPGATFSVYGLQGTFDAANGTIDDGPIVIRKGAPSRMYVEDARVTGNLTVNVDTFFAATEFQPGSSLINNKTITSRGVNTFDSFVNNNGATLTVLGDSDYGNAVLNGPGFNNFGSILLNTGDAGFNAKLNLSSTLFNMAGAMITSTGIVGGADHVLAAPFENDGAMNFQFGTALESSDVTSINRGSIQIDSSFALSFVDIVAAAPIGQLRNLGSINVDASAFLLMQNSELLNAFSNPNRGLLSGNGTISPGLGTVTSDGAIGPGLSPGELTISGNLTLQSNDQMQIEVTGANQGSEYDHLVVTGTATLAGDLVVSVSYAATEGETFTILNATSVTGTFANVVGGDVGNGLVLVPSYTATSVVLTATAGAAHWANGSGGLWSDPNNWNPVGVPDACSLVFIDLPGNYQVQMDQNVEIFNLNLGAGSGAQVLDTQGNDLLIQDAGMILIGGALYLRDSILDQASTSCASMIATAGTVGLTNHGYLEVEGKSDIRIPLINAADGVLHISPNSGGSVLVIDNNPLDNQGTLELGNDNLNLASLHVNSGVLTNSGTIRILPGTSERELITPIDNGSTGTIEVSADLTIDPVQIMIRPQVAAFLAPDQATLVRYSLDESEGDLNDEAALGLDLEPVGESVVAAFHRGRLLDGIDDEIPMDQLQTALLGRSTWTLSWFSRSLDEHTPALQIIPEFFAEKDRGLSDQLWHHFALAWDDNALQLYIDGQLSNSVSFNELADPEAYLVNKLRIGFEDGRYVAGVIDELRASAELPSEERLRQIAAMVEIVNDPTRISAFNDPQGIRQAWVKDLPVGLTETENGFELFSRQLSQDHLGTVAFVTHDGSMGQFEDAALVPDPDAPFTWMLSGTPVINKGAPNDFTNQHMFKLIGNPTVSFPQGTLLNLGTIFGNGTLEVTGAVLSSNGIFAPGDSPGTLTIDGDLILQASSAINIEIGGIAPGSEYDQFVVTGTLTMDGSVNASLINSFNPVGDETFDVVSFGSQVGAFASVNLPPDTSFTAFNYSLLANALQIDTTPIYSFSFNPTTYTTPESATVKRAASITIERTGNTFVGASVTMDSVDTGDATEGVDYVGYHQAVNFVPGQSIQTIDLDILDDRLVEGDEDFSLQLSSPGPGTIGNDTAVVTITDVEQGSFSLDSATYTVAENGGTLNVTVSRIDGGDGAVTVGLISVDGTAQSGSDYTAVNTSLSWASGDIGTRTVVLTILDDQLIEIDEAFTLNLINPTGGAILGSPSSADITISDFEEGSLSFASSAYTANEADSTASILINRIDGSDGDISVSFATADGTASAGQDYTATAQFVTLHQGETSTSVSIPLIPDNVFEGDETVLLSLITLSKRGTAITDATLTILEDDQPPGVLQLSAASYSVSEGGGSLTVNVLRSGGSGGLVTVDFTTFDNGGGATAGSDYTTTSASLIFADGVTSQSVTIPILEDAAIEATEGFGVRIQNPGGGATLGALTSASVAILDNDDPPGTLALVASTFSISEGVGTATFGISRTGGSGGAVSVIAATVANGTATAGQDYTTTTSTLSWANGDASTKFFSVIINDDNTAEPNETFGLALSGATGGATLGTASATVSILDNEVNPAGQIQFGAASYNVQENAGSLHFQVLRTGGSGGRVTVALASLDSSATAGSDYTNIGRTLTFEPFDATPKDIILPILDDASAEGLESLQLVLSNPTNGATLGTPSTARVYISDDESQQVQWTSGGQRHSESNNSITINLSLETPSQEDTYVNVVALPNAAGATEGSDFNLPTNEVVFPPGSTLASFVIQLMDDSLVEGEERVVLQLQSNDLSLGTPNAFELTIIDNDTAQVNWSAVPANAQEGNVSKSDNSIAVTATLTHALQRGGSVPFSTSGTATNLLDYTAAAALVFEAGATTASANLIILDDPIAELAETLILTLSSTSLVSLGADRARTIDVLDDDRRQAFVSWTSENTRVNELDADKADTSVTVEARLSNPFSTAINVNYRVVGIASFGSDHNLVPGTLNFPAGATTASLTFSILGDNREEPDENVAIRLQNGDVRPGLRDTHNVMIVDNDEGQVPDTFIEVQAPDTYLNGVLQVESGNNLRLRGFGSDPQGDTSFQYQWEICLTGACPQFSGNILEQELNTPGTYLITCFAIDADGNRDPTPAELRVQVRTNIPPTVAIVSPEAASLDVLVGSTVDFEASAIDKHKREVTETKWYFQGDEGNATFDTLSFNHTFDTLGDFTLVFEASDGHVSATDSRSIHVYEGDAPPRVNILDPVAGSTFHVGDTINFAGDIVNAGKRDYLDYLWDLGEGNWVTGQTMQYTYETSGNFQVRCFVSDESGVQVGSDVIQISVLDPGESPELTFGFPSGMQIQPGTNKREGACVFLNSIVLDNKGYKDLSFVYDVPGAQLNHETPGLVCFPEEGEYTISLYAVTPLGVQSNVVTRTIIVQNTEDSAYEPNNSLIDAAPILPGNYGNLSLDEEDPEDYFRITLDQPGQRIVATADFQGEGFVQVLDELGVAVGEPRQITGLGNINLTDLPAGDYFLRIYQPDSNKRKALGLSLSINVLNPALYFPDIRNDSTYKTSIGVVNPNNEIICSEIVGFAADGTIIDEIPIELPPFGRRHFEIEELFGELASNVAWTEVDSVGALVGYANTESRDRKELYGVSGNRELHSELHVPHIAEKTEQWYTRAAIINGSSAAVTVDIDTPDDSASAVLNTAFAKDSFDFVERLGGLNPESRWATIRDKQAEPNIAGVEVFGTYQNRIVAGLEMSDVRRDNPNFTFVRNNLYYTHIARGAGFYTGIALVNLGGFDQNVIIHAYREDGTEVGNGLPITIGKNEKFVDNAEHLLAAMNTTPAQVDWILVEADADITGFELFGTNDGKQLAGIEAARGLRDAICYPFLDTSPATFHGVSAVNVNDTPIGVTFTLYRNDGSVIAQVNQTLLGHQKLVKQLTGSNGLFPNLDPTQIPGWLSATSSVTGKPIAGFELFINGNNNEQMGAIIAE